MLMGQAIVLAYGPVPFACLVNTVFELFVVILRLMCNK